jgi:hypothetical protein
MQFPTEQHLEFMQDYYLGTKIMHKSHQDVPWKERDQDWFRTDQWYLGQLHVLKLLFEGITCNHS